MEYEVVARVRYGIWGGHIGTNMTFSRVNSRIYVVYLETLWLVGRALPITFCVLHWQSRPGVYHSVCGQAAAAVFGPAWARCSSY